MRAASCALFALVAAAVAPLAEAAPAPLGVDGTSFTLAEAPGQLLTSRDMVGRVLELPDGRGGTIEVRIDAVAPAEEQPSVMLHTLVAKDPATGAWTNLCDADSRGRHAAFPVRGRWDGRRFVADEKAWFLTCSAGAQGKCVLWGYDPWGKTPDGRPLTDFYRACQQAVRADYAGVGEAHTRSGTLVDTSDVGGVRMFATAGQQGFGFEAGWGVDGAVCVARTRRPELLSRKALLASAPQLGGRCDETTARAKGALIFTQVAKR